MKLFSFIRYKWGYILTMAVFAFIWKGMYNWWQGFSEFSTGMKVLFVICCIPLVPISIAWIAAFFETWKSLELDIQAKGNKAKMREQAIKLEQEREEEEKRKSERLALIDNGTWVFPNDQLYSRCLENGVTNIDDVFYLKKARVLAGAIMDEYGASKQQQERYLADEQIREYYLAAQKNAEEKARKEQEERVRLESTPRKGQPNEEEQRIISEAESLIKFNGISKRDRSLEMEYNQLSSMKDKIVEAITTKRKQAEDAREAMLKLGVAFTQASQQPKTNMGVHAGIASAVAGPIAGAVIAGDIMRKNAEIDQKNAQAEAYWSHNTAMMMNSISNSANASIAELCQTRDEIAKRLEEIEAERKSIQLKVVFDDLGTDELKKFIKPVRKRIVRNKNNVMEIVLTIQNKYVPNVPEGVNVVVDGALFVDIFGDSIRIGRAYVPFPRYGVPCGKEVEIRALCPYYLEGEHKYSVKYTYHNLWLMEQ